MKKLILERLIKRIIIKDAPKFIPLTLPKASDRDYYAAYFKTTDDAYLTIKSIQGNDVKSDRHDASQIVTEETNSLSELSNMSFDVTYYLRRYQFHSKSVIFFETMSTIKGYHLLAYFNDFNQWRYNKRTIATLDRFAILRHLIDETIIDPEAKFNVIAVIGRIFENRVIYHPEFNSRKKYYNLIFKSLEEEGLISLDNINYKINPKALTALSTYEEERQRHANSMTVQKILSLITFLSVIGIFIQAYIAYIASNQ